jgi:RNA polymerase sigma-70 factor, ECF subfamily
MLTRERDLRRGLATLRLAVLHALDPESTLLVAGVGDLADLAGPAGPLRPRRPVGAGSTWLLAEAAGFDASQEAAPDDGSGHRQDRGGDRALASASAVDEAEAERLIALVELARDGDADAFGMLYDHYHPSIYRFVYYRVGSVALAEDLTSETFFKALRGMSSFRWQGKDFGAWLTTIARNLTTDHFKAGRTRLERVTEDMTPHDEPTDGPETSVLASLDNQALLGALTELPHEQQECLVMRFLQGLSIAETAQVLGRSDGAVKQLQLRGVRNLAKLLGEDLR